MILRYLKCSLLVFCTLVVFVDVSPAVANEITHLNIGRVDIENQSTNSQNRAGKKAFEQVLVKLSGSKNVLQNELLSRSARNFQQYLVSSSYLSINGNLIYQATFAQDKLLELLQFASVPVWGNLRPKTTLWLAKHSNDVQLSDKQTIKIVTQLSGHPWLESINEIAFARGIDLLIPVGDLEDSVNVSNYDVWGMFAPSIAQYSKKFGNEYTLVARISLGFDEISSQEAYIAEWTVVGDKLIYTSKSAGVSEEFALNALLSDYTDYLASRHAVSSELLAISRIIEIEVFGIESLKMYASALRALEGIAVVSKVSVKQQNKEAIRLVLSVNADEDTLSSVLQLDDRFRQFQPDEFGSTETMRYEWVGK